MWTVVRVVPVAQWRLGAIVGVVSGVVIPLCGSTSKAMVDTPCSVLKKHEGVGLGSRKWMVSSSSTYLHFLAVKFKRSARKGIIGIVRGEVCGCWSSGHFLVSVV